MAKAGFGIWVLGFQLSFGCWNLDFSLEDAGKNEKIQAE
jgi:hypothetical protein